MQWLLKSVVIVDPRSKHHLKKRDVLVGDGKILEIKASIETKDAEIINFKGAMVSPGWIDLGANLSDPGFEYRETIQTGLNALARGGFSGAVVLPANEPVTDKKAAVEYISNAAQNHAVAVYPAGTISKERKGRQLAEMRDMGLSGAMVFTDDKPINHADLMNRGLEYAKNNGSLLYAIPHDEQLAVNGQMHEGSVSTSLGIPGIPSVAEESRLLRDIEILRYTGGRLHIYGISSQRSVEIIKQAKKDGLNVTVSIAAHQLRFSDESMDAFDSNYKVLPPFRTEADRKALIKGIQNGVIDAIHSDHRPHDVEEKDLEFERADFGISSAETFFGCIAESLSIEPEKFIKAVAIAPREILGLEDDIVEVGSPVNLTLFSTEGVTSHNQETWQSASKNSPFFGKELKGQVFGVLRGEKAIFNH